MTEPSLELQEQIEFLLQEYRNGAITDIHQLMRLIEMAYSDYLDFHPPEKENYYDGKERPE